MKIWMYERILILIGKKIFLLLPFKKNFSVLTKITQAQRKVTTLLNTFLKDYDHRIIPDSNQGGPLQANVTLIYPKLIGVVCFLKLFLVIIFSNFYLGCQRTIDKYNNRNYCGKLP